jgi:NADH:ubiquinone oxidoreductase subunit 4 (subunit M)
MVKIPVIGLHYWLPKAHVEASTRGSIILAGLLLKLGCYGIYRYVRILLKIPTLLTWLWLVLTILAGLVTLIQSDVKKLIAYSRVVHITLLMIAVYTDINILRILLLVSLAHGGASILLFFLMGSRRKSIHSRIITLMVPEESIS